MTSTTERQTEQAIDGDRLMSFVFRAVDEVGATLNAALVVVGDELGYYRALADGGPLTAAELAVATGTTRTTPASGSTRRRRARSWTTTPRLPATRSPPSTPSP